ncbi:MAG: MazG-like family protein [Bacillota bacterium]|jgi:hypothetical protein
MYKDQDFDIARNIKAVEWLKTEIILNAGQVCRALLNAKDDLALQALANTIISSYLLAKRLGVSYGRLESVVQQRAKAAQEEGHELEKWYQDLSALAEHFDAGRPR